MRVRFRTAVTALLAAAVASVAAVTTVGLVNTPGSAIIAGSGLFVIWRERQLALARKRDAQGELGVAATAVRLRTP